MHRWYGSGRLENRSYPVNASTASTVVRYVSHGLGRMASWFGMITAMVRVEQLTRARSSPPSLGRTRATFQVDEGTVTCPLASVVVTPPLLPVPPTPLGPETIYS